jgi:hypothetical protein
MRPDVISIRPSGRRASESDDGRGPHSIGDCLLRESFGVHADNSMRPVLLQVRSSDLFILLKCRVCLGPTPVCPAASHSGSQLGTTHAGRRLRASRALTRDGAEAGRTKYVGWANATDHLESNLWGFNAVEFGMAGVTVRRENQVSFDYLGAVSQNLGDRVGPFLILGCYCRNSSGHRAALNFGSIPQVAG